METMKQKLEKADDVAIEKHFRSHPELPNGRTFLFNRERDTKADKNYRDNFDSIFPNAPGVGVQQYIFVHDTLKISPSPTRRKKEIDDGRNNKYRK